MSLSQIIGRTLDGLPKCLVTGGNPAQDLHFQERVQSRGGTLPSGPCSSLGSRGWMSWSNNTAVVLNTHIARHFDTHLES